MKKLLPILLIVSACSSTTSNMSPSSKRRSISSEEDYTWIEQLNFDKKVEEKYKADNDEFKFSSADESAHALVKESLTALPTAKLEEALGKTNDILSQINIKCYQSKFDEAFKLADDNYLKYKNNTSYWNQIGTCYFLKLDYAKAILFYNKSRDLDKKFIPPVNNLGVVYERQGKVQKALAAFKMAVDTNAFSLTPAYNLANLYLRYGTVGKAYSILQGLQKRSPQDVKVSSALASSWLIKGNYQAAADIYSKFDKATLALPEVGLNYAVALKFLKRPLDAQTVLSNVSETSGPISEYAQKVEKFVRN